MAKKLRRDMPTLQGMTFATLLSSTTLEWRRVRMRKATAAVEGAIGDLLADGLIEARVVAIARMGNKKTPKSFYIASGPCQDLIDKQLDNLVPSGWLGTDGKPRDWLRLGANVVAIRLTPRGYDLIQAVKADRLDQWSKTHPKRIKPYLQCDGAALPKLVLSQLQQAIHTALEGKALKKQPLANLVCAAEGTRLYRKDGIKEMMADGLVAHKPGVGYYRPDAPPAGLVVRTR
jgi:hypothetical protein